MSTSGGQHKRHSSDGVDPFSHPDIYYGEKQGAKKVNHRRAFSSVGYNYFLIVLIY